MLLQMLSFSLGIPSIRLLRRVASRFGSALLDSDELRGAAKNSITTKNTQDTKECKFFAQAWAMRS
jgi:hypothetical protein